MTPAAAAAAFSVQPTGRIEALYLPLAPSPSLTRPLSLALLGFSSASFFFSSKLQSLLVL